MPHLTWSRRAATSISRILTYYEDDPQLANKALDTIADSVDLLLQFPRSGRPVPSPEGERRELILPFGRSAYILLYQIEGDAITVIAVRHSKLPSY